MGQTLTHGVYLPDEGERNCYSGLAANWQLLDGAVGTIAEHTSALAGKAPLVHTHSKSDVTDLLNSNFIPSANNSYDLGSSSYQWNNLYAKNYYYNGTAWGLDKANVWTENNKFSKSVSPSDITGVNSNTMAFTGLRSVIFFNTTGSSNRQSYGTFLYSGYSAGTAPDNYGQLQLLRSTDKKGETNNGLIPDTSFAMWRVAPHYLLIEFMNSVRVTNNGTENSLKPITNNATDLGTSDNKWKTLNGVNPGALSLPRIVQADSRTFDTTNWDFTGTNWNTLDTSAMTGWGYIYIAACGTTDFILIRRGGTGNSRPTQSANPILDNDGKYYLYITFPIVQSTNVYALIRTTGTITTAVVYPCQGNV